VYVECANYGATNMTAGLDQINVHAATYNENLAFRSTLSENPDKI